MKLSVVLKPALVAVVGTLFLFPAPRAARAQNADAPIPNKTWLGATLSFDSLEAKQAYGAKVERVAPGSPAARAGVKAGDIVLTIASTTVRMPDDLQQAIRSLPAGSQVQFELYRSGQPLMLNVVLGGSAASSSQKETSEISKPERTDSVKAQPTAKGPQPARVGVTESPVTSPQSTGVFINEREIKPEQLRDLRRNYGGVPPRGHYWYDSRSGLYGAWGHETAGYIRPGHDFGPLPANASSGNSGVFVNGRELNMPEVLYLQQTFGAVYPGHWWFDGRTGYLGLEGNPLPVANVFAMLQQAQQRRSGGGGGYRWRDGRGSVLTSEGGCTMMTTPTTTVSAGNCN